MDDVIKHKVASTEKYVRRIREEAQKDWMNDFAYQDALILNLERACQTCIDAASIVVRKEKLGIPKFSREVFDLLLVRTIVISCLNLINKVGVIPENKDLSFQNFYLSGISLIKKWMVDYSLPFGKIKGNSRNKAFIVSSIL